MLNDAAREALSAGHLAHLVTLNPDGSPQLSIVWVGLDFEGGGPELLQRLAHVYLGPEVRFPAWDDPPAGVVVHITPERVAGVGPWTD